MNLHATQDKALESYFDALLFAEDGSLFDDAEEVSPLFSSKNKREKQNRETQESVNNFQTLPLTYQADLHAEAPVIVDDEPVNVTVASPAIQTIAGATKQEEKFLFVRPITVVGLKLAISMESITEVLSIDARELHKVTHKDGVYATLHYRQRDIPVLDTAAVVIPMNHPRRAAMLARKNYQHVLVLDEGRFAIAVDAMDEQVYLPAGSMRWRDATTQHNWLAGTWVDYGYALVDTDRLLNCL